jgi:hypothetical protein
VDDLPLAILTTISILLVPIGILLIVLAAQYRAAALVALGVRVAAGLLILEFGLAETFAPDAPAYAIAGQLLAESWRSEAGAVFSAPESGHGRFMVLNAIAHLALGKASVVVMILTSAAGAWTASLAGRIAQSIAGKEAGLRAFWLVALFPSLVLWSALGLRDSFTILGVVGAAWVTIRLKERITPGLLMELGAWLGLISVFREYLVAITAAGVALGFLFGRRPGVFSSPVFSIVVVASVVLLVNVSGIGQQLVSEVAFDRLSEIRRGFASEAGSAFLADVDISTPARALAHLPFGLVYFLFAPFPWATSGLLQRLTIPEMLLWYWLIPKIWSGGRTAFRTYPHGFWVLLTISASLSIAYALISGNIGTAYRHRAQVLPPLLALAASGWVSQRQAERARAEIRLSADLRPTRALADEIAR